MSARGEYRAVYSVLLDSPEFQALSKDGKLLWHSVKHCCGLSGIDVVFDDQLAERAGLTKAELSAARAELVASKWIQVQGRIHWLVNGLRFEPSISLKNPKHRKGIESHLRGLPRAEIVARMAAHYQLEYDIPGSTPPTSPQSSPQESHPIPTAIPSDTLPIAPRITETENGDGERRRKTETERESNPPPGLISGNSGDDTETLRLVLLAADVCGQGSWSDREKARAVSIVRGWFKRGRSAATIEAALRGSRLLVDAGKVVNGDGVPWLRPLVPFGLRALQNTGTLYDQGDGKAARPFFDVAEDAYVQSLTTPDTGPRGGGATRVGDLLPPTPPPP